jgi:Family of unknown function (DUF6441)
MPTSINPPSITPQLDAQADKIKQRIEKALAAAVERLAENVLQEGRSDIARAGRFGARWTQGFTAEVDGTGTVRTVTFRQAVPYWKVFQYGALIQGKPLLWIPLSHTGITVRARDFPGRLFRVDRKSGGAPLLLSTADKQPKYHGQQSVRIPKKFHLVEIIRAESKTIGALYRLELTSG